MRYWLIFSLWICSTAGWAGDEDAGALSVRAAAALYQQAVRGESGAGERASARFSSLRQQDPAHVLLYSAYLAGLQVLQGRDAWWPWDKLRMTERGLDGLEKVWRQLQPADDRVIVAGVPLGLEVRLLVARSFLAVPGFFQRDGLGRQVLKEALASPSFTTAAAPVQAEFHFAVALLAEKDQQTAALRAALQRVVDLAPGEPVAAEAGRRLRALKS